MRLHPRHFFPLRHCAPSFLVRASGAVALKMALVPSTDCDKYKYDKYKMCDKVFEHRYPEKWEEKAWMKLYFPWEDVTIFILFTTWELYCKVFISNIIEYHPTQVLYFVQFFINKNNMNVSPGTPRIVRFKGTRALNIWHLFSISSSPPYSQTKGIRKEIKAI